MQKQINQKIKSGDAVDIGFYWLCKLTSLYTIYIINWMLYFNFLLVGEFSPCAKGHKGFVPIFLEIIISTFLWLATIKVMFWKKSLTSHKQLPIGLVNWPFKSQYLHTNSPDWSPHIFLKNKLRDFDKKNWSIFSLVIIFFILITSFFCSCVDFVRRKLVLVTLGTKMAKGPVRVKFRQGTWPETAT